MPDNKQTDETGSRQKLTDSDIAPSSTNRLFFDGIDSGTNGLFPGLYSYNDIDIILGIKPSGTITSRIYDLDRLLEKDKLREKDGFPRKIKLGKLIKPAKDGTDKTIIIPSTNEEKFYHWMSESEAGDGQSTGGSGEGDEGEVIGESPLRPDDEGDGTGAGKGGSGDHGMGADAYEVGRVLTEQFELPNIKEKGKKTSLTKYTYDMSDKNPGHGQMIDKKATLRRVVKTNLALGNISGKSEIDASGMIITPGDRIYRILSRERDYEAQAVVFFVRDYSGSMSGKPTEAIVSQHVYINSWLVFQYKRQIKSRFIVHDTEAIEVPDFYTYYNKAVAGGTDVASAYILINKIIAEENLAKNYNIYIFHGTDGDDFDNAGTKAIAELIKMKAFASRVGITIAENSYSSRGNTVVENYLRKSKLFETAPDVFHMDSFRATEADEGRIIKSIKTLIS
ncbi:MAG: DUF444 family protein [Ignavibacteriales bacterium]|nr:DUF444 family protein [Ignavibacteriales bacterium]